MMKPCDEWRPDRTKAYISPSMSRQPIRAERHRGTGPFSGPLSTDPEWQQALRGGARAILWIALILGMLGSAGATIWALSGIVG